MKDADRDVVIGNMADAIGAKFLGGVPRGPVIDAIKDTLREESVVLVNDWESYSPPRVIAEDDDDLYRELPDQPALSHDQKNPSEEEA